MRLLNDPLNPFMFGKVAHGQGFTNRSRDMANLIRDFRNGIHTILISPRRWGKSSLIQKITEQIADQYPNYKICQIDLFNIKDEDDFYELYSQEIIKSTSSKFEEWKTTAKEYLAAFMPVFSYSVDPNTDLKLSLNLKDGKNNFIDILNLPEKLAIKNNFKIIVCIDEFQNIGGFENPLLFQKRLRAQWQHHKNVTYCLYGSKRHLMMELFEKRSFPFYRFGQSYYLEKIEAQEWESFIIQNFERFNKKIAPEFCTQITDLMECNSYYVQQLSYLIWEITKNEVSKEIVNMALERFFEQNRILYQLELELLTAPQTNFLKALCSGVDKNFTSQDVISTYKLGSSANVIRAINGLLKKDMIDKMGKTITFVDPGFRLWLKRIYKI